MTTDSRFMFDTLDIMDGRILAAMDERDMEDREWSPVPMEYDGMSFEEILSDMREYAQEALTEEIERYWHSRERNAEYWR